MKQNQNNLRVIGGRLAGLLLMAAAAPLAFTACESQQPEINITLESDYSKIISAINDANSSLTNKLALIEAVLSGGFSDNQDTMALIQEAVESLSGSMAEKLAAIEAAVKAQTTSLEAKLALIETALNNGFADDATALSLIKTAVESLSSSVGSDLNGKINDVVSALGDVTTSLNTGAVATALANILDSVNGISDYNDMMAAILKAIEDLGVATSLARFIVG